jgi:hypothetical protein
MQYKAKFSSNETSLTNAIEVGEIFNSDSGRGVLVFIPLTDTNFFEPIKNRKFEIEVSEKDMGHFDYVMADEPWTVTEITTPNWVAKYKASGCFNANVFSTDELCTLDIEVFKDNYLHCKLNGVKWLKDRFGKGLKESQELADFIFDL